MRPYYREYDLPWASPREDAERFRKILIATLIFTIVMAIVIPLLPVPEREETQVEDVPPRLAKLMIEQRKPPPPPKPQETPKPDSKPVAKPDPKPVDRVRQARERAVAALLPMQDQLADLRDHRMIEVATAARPLTDAAQAGTTQRSLITSNVGRRSSGGINTEGLSRGISGGGGNLQGRATTQVGGGLGDGPRAVRSGSGQKASRSREEIELVFDKNKGAIYALYNRALRNNAALQGKVVLELTIAPWGEVTSCRVISSELNDAELERKLIARVKLFRFEDKDVEAVTTTKPIDFFPA
jgi:periplasmic protein TonB